MQALGRGLGSLIPDKKQNNFNYTSSSLQSVHSQAQILEIDISKIRANKSQPRREFNEERLKELANSIREHGILQPLIVISRDGEYELIAGERRLRASQMAGRKTVPVIIKNTSEQEKLELALIENIQRENLNPIELALSYQELISKFSLSQEDLASRLGKSRSSIANVLRLLNLPAEIQQALRDGKISEGHARDLAGLDSEVAQLNAFRKIVNHKLSVHDARKIIVQAKNLKKKNIQVNHYRDQAKEEFLRDFFKSKVQLKRKQKGGEIIIKFFSDIELEEIMKRIKS